MTTAEEPGPAEVVRRYLSRPQMAKRWGLQPDTLNRYKLPSPDAQIGRLRGWLPQTADDWRNPLTREQVLTSHRELHTFLSKPEVARRIGLVPDSLNHGYVLPPHDAEIGKYRGWLPQTIDSWRQSRQPKKRPE